MWLGSESNTNKNVLLVIISEMCLWYLVHKSCHLTDSCPLNSLEIRTWCPFLFFCPSNVSICWPWDWATKLLVTLIMEERHSWYWCLVSVPASGWRWGHQESGQTRRETWQSLSWHCLRLSLRWHENQSSCLSTPVTTTIVHCSVVAIKIHKLFKYQ